MTGPPSAGRPAHVAADRAQRVEVAVLAAEVDGAADHHRRGLGPARQRVLPDRLAGLRVELDDVAGDEVDDVEAVLGVGRRGGVEAADAAFPEHLAGVGVEGEGGAVVVDEVELAADVDRRELEQRPLGVAPELAERRLDPLRRQVAGAGRVEPEHRPVDRLRLRLRRLLRHEGGVGVVDVGRALEQLVGEHAGAEDDDRPRRRSGRPPARAGCARSGRRRPRRRPGRFPEPFSGAAPAPRRAGSSALAQPARLRAVRTPWRRRRSVP